MVVWGSVCSGRHSARVSGCVYEEYVWLWGEVGWVGVHVGGVWGEAWLGVEEVLVGVEAVLGVEEAVLGV